MTPKEAIEILQEEHDYAQHLSYVNAALKQAIESLEKQIPKKPFVIEKQYFGCPYCEHDLGVDCDDIYVYEILKPNYCECCGQHLDWSDDNDREGKTD